MKTKILLYFAVILANIGVASAQSPTVTISDVKVDNISIGAGPINFGSSPSISLKFKVTFLKEENLSIGNTLLHIGVYKPSYFALFETKSQGQNSLAF